MYLFTLAMKQATILVPFVVFLSVTALPPDLRRRADPNDPCLNETPTLDGLTSDKSAGIGVEFEVSAVVFSKPGCSPADTNQAKGQQVGDRKGDNWQLTADTTSEIAGLLNAEYILNGKTIKVGTGAASAAAAAVSSDIVRIHLIVEIHSFHMLIGPCRSHGAHTQVCPIINGILRATTAIRGQYQILEQAIVQVTSGGLHKSLHPCLSKPSMISLRQRWSPP